MSGSSSENWSAERLNIKSLFPLLSAWSFLQLLHWTCDWSASTRHLPFASLKSTVWLIPNWSRRWSIRCVLFSEKIRCIDGDQSNGHRQLVAIGDWPTAFDNKMLFSFKIEKRWKISKTSAQQNCLKARSIQTSGKRIYLRRSISRQMPLTNGSCWFNLHHLHTNQSWDFARWDEVINFHSNLLPRSSTDMPLVINQFLQPSGIDVPDYCNSFKHKARLHCHSALRQLAQKSALSTQFELLKLLVWLLVWQFITCGCSVITFAKKFLVLFFWRNFGFSF